jgi:hypothetical protein
MVMPMAKVAKAAKTATMTAPIERRQGMTVPLSDRALQSARFVPRFSRVDPICVPGGESKPKARVPRLQRAVIY